MVKKAAQIESWLADQKQTAHAMTLAGGDVDRGRAVFQNQGVCMKCHKAERGGGDAGPELTYIARLRQPHELLESVLEPNAQVVPGFGTISLVLDDGLVVEGTPVNETPEQITIKTPIGETKVISVESIEDRSGIRSPMPQPTENLSLLEFRDLMAYLQQLETRE
jgi:quinoprotein glucose dehydrogenase